MTDSSTPTRRSGRSGRSHGPRLTGRAGLRRAARATLATLGAVIIALAACSAPSPQDDDAANPAADTAMDAATDAAAQQARMTFFVTSAGPGHGADLGGLDGADAHCQALAAAVGADDLAWHAYLSVPAAPDRPAVNARDRIGAGPWHNQEGVLIARDVDELHSDAANLTKQTILTEEGAIVNGRGDRPNEHDILTGSTLDGRAFDPGEDTSCSAWTSDDDGSARVGHHDRQGGGEHPESWNSAHGSRGCSQSDLQGTGGNGYFYCFAAGPRG